MTQVQTTLVALAGLVSICIPGIGTNPHGQSRCTPATRVNVANGIQPVRRGERLRGSEILQRLHLEGCVLPHASREGSEFRFRIPGCRRPCSGAAWAYTALGRLTEDHESLQNILLTRYLGGFGVPPSNGVGNCHLLSPLTRRGVSHKRETCLWHHLRAQGHKASAPVAEYIL